MNIAKTSAIDVADARIGSLVVVGTGIQGAGQTTLAARRAVEKADRVLFAAVDPWTVHWLRELNPAAESLPYPMDGSPRRKTYALMAERILEELRKGLKVCAVFYGHPGVLVDSAHAAIRQARSEGFTARMLPGVSALDCLFADLGVDPGREGCQIYEATDFLIRQRCFDMYSPLILCQVGLIGNRSFYEGPRSGLQRRGLQVLAETLCSRYPSMHGALIYEAAVLPTEQSRMEPVLLAELAGAPISDLSTLYVPPLEEAPIAADVVARLGMELPQGVARAELEAMLSADHAR